MIYIASPYSHPSAYVRALRYKQVRLFTMAAIKNGFAAFSPIMYMHEAAVEYDLPKDAAFWHNFNMQFLRKADSLTVLMLDGWMESKGVSSEISTAQHIHIPVNYITVVTKGPSTCG